MQTGAAEDSRVYVSLADFAEWTHVPYSTVEISASGSAEEVSAVIQRLGQALPGADVHPVRQVTEGEANVLGKMRSTLLVASILIILTAAVCVLSTLTGWVSDRRRDFALMKALGASGRMLQGFFAAEAAALGAIGATAWFCHRSRSGDLDRPRQLSCPGYSPPERVAGRSGGRDSHRPDRRDPANISAAAGPTCYHPEGRMT